MNNPNKKQEDRNKRIYKLYKRRAYTTRGLAKLFRISQARVTQIVRDMKAK